jgi:hypothetical protein
MVIWPACVLRGREWAIRPGGAEFRPFRLEDHADIRAREQRKKGCNQLRCMPPLAWTRTIMVMRIGPTLLILFAWIGLGPCVLPVAPAEADRELLVAKRFLNLPVKNHALKHRVKLLVDGQVAREFEIELAERESDFWVFLDLAPFLGKHAIIQVDGQPADSCR